MSLFRKEALDYQKDKSLGEVLLLKSFLCTAAVICIGILFFIAVVFVFVGKYNRTQAVDGYLSPSSPIVNIRSTRSGLIKESFIKNGDIVEEGDILFLLESYENLPQSGNANDLLIKTYTDRLDKLKQQKKYAEEKNSLAINNLYISIDSAKKNIALLDSNSELLLEILIKSEERWENAKKLYEKKVISKINLDEHRDKVLNAKLNLNEVKLKIRNLKDSLEKFIPEVENQKLNLENEIRQLSEKENQLTESIIDLNIRKNIAIKAPITGKISFVNVTAGELVSGDILAAILPLDTKIEATLLVPSSAIGFLEKNQKVLMRYTSFPYQKFGLQVGQISTINQSILLPHELRGNSMSVNEAVYLVNVKLSKQTVQAYGREFDIRPGMTLSADIELEKRTIIEWFLEPLFTLKGRI